MWQLFKYWNFTAPVLRSFLNGTLEQNKRALTKWYIRCYCFLVVPREIFLNYSSIWWLENIYAFEPYIAFLTWVNLCYPFGALFCKLLKGVLPPSTPALTGEAQMLPDIKNTCHQTLVKKLLGTTKRNLCLINLLP